MILGAANPPPPPPIQIPQTPPHRINQPNPQTPTDFCCGFPNKPHITKSKRHQILFPVMYISGYVYFQLCQVKKKKIVSLPIPPLDMPPFQKKIVPPPPHPRTRTRSTRGYHSQRYIAIIHPLATVNMSMRVRMYVCMYVCKSAKNPVQGFLGGGIQLMRIPIYTYIHIHNLSSNRSCTSSYRSCTSSLFFAPFCIIPVSQTPISHGSQIRRARFFF